MRNYGAKQSLARIASYKDFLNEKIKDPRYYWKYYVTRDNQTFGRIIKLNFNFGSVPAKNAKQDLM